MERSAQLEQLIEAWFSAASRGDLTLVSKHVSTWEGARMYGSDPGAVLEGGKAVAEFLAGEVEHAGGRASFSLSNTEAFSEGNVGWATTRITIRLADGRNVSPRWSAVFYRENELWKLVQVHASLGVPNRLIPWRDRS
ncbi:MAG TPA: nuclear transport factor 2 family protein [Polyangiales bacterium]|nr:nuclear transport factor 2 family protein [Polyangiales bacterium]